MRNIVDPNQQVVETYESLAGLIDYEMLAPELSHDQVHEGCGLARAYAVRAMLVRPIDVDHALRWMEGSGVTVASTVGWPEGTSTTAVKLYEGRDLLRRGVTELEMVISAAKMISREFQYVEMELLQMSRSCQEHGATLKIVLRENLLGNDQKIIATKIAKRIEAQFLVVRHTPEVLELLKPLLKDRIELKASGAESLEDTLALREAGYRRIGTPSAAAILDAWKARLEAQHPAERPERAS